VSSAPSGSAAASPAARREDRRAADPAGHRRLAGRDRRGLPDKLAAVGLVEPERRLTVGQFTDKWLADKTAAGDRIASVISRGQTVTDLTALFGDKPLASLAHADGQAYRSEMQTRGLRPATVHHRLGHARQMFEDAVRLGHILANPWRHVRVRIGDPSERRAYVSVADVGCVIDHCPNYWWKLLAPSPASVGCGFHPRRSP
jgi:hypothetical protein